MRAGVGIARILKTEGVSWVSCFPVSPIINPLAEEGVKILMARSERIAVAMADGYSRVSNGHNFGVCTVQGGLNPPGMQNAFSGLAQAYEDSSPVMCITGGVPRPVAGATRFSIDKCFEGVAKWVGYINSPNRVPEFMRRAFTFLRTGRPSPVIVELPDDMENEEYDDTRFPYKPIKGWKSAGDPRDVEVAVKALLAAKNPLIYAGQGIFHADACDELREFAELVQAPVLTTLLGKSMFPEDHPLSIGVRGEPAEYFLNKADLVFVIGSSLSPTHFRHNIPNPSSKVIIHSTNSEIDINNRYATDHAILGDAKLVLRQVIDQVKRQAGARAGRKNEALVKEIKDHRDRFLKEYMPLLTSNDVPINPYRVYWDLMNTVDRKNAIVTHEAGNTRDQISAVYEAITPHSFVGWGNVSTLGFGLGVALGAKLAYPNKMAFWVTGDAGCGMVLGDLETATRLKIPITAIHINNSGFGGYGPGFWGRGHHPPTSSVSPPNVVNMAKVAEGLGQYSERVEKPDEVSPAIKRAMRANRDGQPAYLEVICSQHPVYPGWAGPAGH